jgi:hypothetical protein
MPDYEPASANRHLGLERATLSPFGPGKIGNDQPETRLDALNHDLDITRKEQLEINARVHVLVMKLCGSHGVDGENAPKPAPVANGMIDTMRERMDGLKAAQSGSHELISHLTAVL